MLTQDTSIVDKNMYSPEGFDSLLDDLPSFGDRSRSSGRYSAGYNGRSEQFLTPEQLTDLL